MVGTLIPDFEKIFVDEDSLGSALDRRVREVFPAEKIQVVTGSPLAHAGGTLSAEQFERSKRLLWIKPFRGQFFKRCPGSTQKKTLNCCNYHILNLGQQCHYNCSYCYLQSYLNTPALQMYSNIEDAISELDEMASQNPDLPFRVGTGEVIDSLNLDPLTLFSRQLIPFFRKYPKWVLEFKTKSACVDQFLDMEHAGNVVVSWSINPSVVIEKEEHGTASMHQRLLAAEKCRDRGFPIAFHIDPLIYFENWKDYYADLVNQISSRFLPEQLHVISVGSLRFQPEQRHLMRERFGMNSWVTAAEMFPSEGGKMRYDASLRQSMYQFVRNEFAAKGSGWKIFFCMETPETWISTFGTVPARVPELKPFFRKLVPMSGAEGI